MNATTTAAAVARPVSRRTDEAELTILFAQTGENIDNEYFGADIRGYLRMRRGAFRGAPRMTRVEIGYEALLQCGTVLIRPTGYRGYTGDGNVAGVLTSQCDAMRPFVAGIPLSSSLLAADSVEIERLHPYVWYPHDTWSEIVDATAWRPTEIPQKFRLKSPFAGKYVCTPSMTKSTQRLRFDVNAKVTEIELPRRATLTIAPGEEVRCGDYFAEVELPEETKINRAKHGWQDYERLVREQNERIFTRSRQVARTYMKYVLPELREDGVVVKAGRDSILPAMLTSSPMSLREDEPPVGCGPYVSEDRGPLLRLLGQGRILWNIQDAQRFVTQVMLSRLRTERSGVALEVLTSPWAWRR